MNGFALLIWVALLWFSVELGLGIRSWTTAKRYAHDLRVEKTTREFASARNKLMHLARTGMIDVESETFRTFYYLTTFVMRRPDQYPEISEALMKVIVLRGKSASYNLLKEESRKWTPEVKKLVREVSGAFSSLLVDYSSLFRFLLRLENFFRAMSIFVRFSEQLKASFTGLGSRDPFISNVIQAQQQMDQIAA